MASSRQKARRQCNEAQTETLITNPDKVLFPKPGYTKRDLVEYYLAVAEGALRGAGGRPNMMVRYPGGIEGELTRRAIHRRLMHH